MPQRENKSGDSLRINREITAQEVRLIAADGAAIGVVSIRDALEAAAVERLDLVEISPKAEPPVCKVMDYGKYRYEQQKKKNEARKNQKIIDVKEIQLRPGIDDHDLDVKMRAAERFLKSGDKVKITMRFRGREISHQAVGLQVLNQISGKLEDIAKLDAPPKLEGKQYLMILTPITRQA
ncbi:MAG: translation initiation factor IF-3 [Holosporales bacterium]|jgi:translation initiation factor IF-3|nr:translation initiation factor IF-3 [Holosporales bacterium]